MPLWVRVLVIFGIVAGAVGMVGQGFWQLARLGERRALNAQIRRWFSFTAILVLGPLAYRYQPGRKRRTG